ncbi:hypothetical protein OHA77_17670 [Streptosporangium sp. NBC_01639]|uniref:hypothetical protein n=1 Tax=Streptosporangium sp. NBC_01639 TaxID=2975948 RepID=UPI003864F649|nr:hypothetical protein OHA77_17670 [Streptosporangium sp. NBC_01639]
MARFQCAGCNRRHSTATGCPRCGSTGPQIQRCHSHGTRPLSGCRACRSLARSYSGI